MKLKPLVAAAGLSLAAATGAQAAAYDFGVHGNVEVSGLVGGGLLVPVGVFADTYTFDLLANTMLVSSTTVANNLGNGSILNISRGAYSLWSAGGNNAIGGGDDTKLGGDWSFNGSSGNLTNAVNIQTTGKYFYVVEGMADGPAGGQYTLTSNVVPVPEPETYALMLAGLAAVGFVARRRQPK